MREYKVGEFSSCSIREKIEIERTTPTTLNRVIRDKVQSPTSYQYLPVYVDSEEDLGYVGPIKSGAIILYKFPQGVNYDITSVMIQFLNLNGVFTSLPTNDMNMDIMNFVG